MYDSVCFRELYIMLIEKYKLDPKVAETINAQILKVLFDDGNEKTDVNGK